MGADLDYAPGFQEVETDPAPQLQGLAGQGSLSSQRHALSGEKGCHLPVSRDQMEVCSAPGGPVVVLCCLILSVQGKLTSGDPREAREWGGQ